MYRWTLKPQFLVGVPLLLLMMLVLACGTDATPTPVVIEKVVVVTATPTPTTAPTPTPQGGGIIGGEANILVVGFVGTWDPHQSGGGSANEAISPLYNQLVEYNPISPTDIIGDLAESWDVEDAGLTYVFHLAQGIKWWDGEDLDADDVVFSLERIVAEGEPRPRAGALRAFMKGVEKVDSDSVKVTLTRVTADFMKNLATDYMKIVPKHHVETGVDINLYENVLGNGPFKPDKFQRGDFIRHVRNPDYFKVDRPYLDAMTQFQIEDPGTAAAAFKTGGLDLAWAPNAFDVEGALALEESMGRDKIKVYFTPVVGVQHVFPNVTKEPWNDSRVVYALWLATDRYEFIQAFGAGKFGIAAPFPVGHADATSMEDIIELPGYGGTPGSSRSKQDDIDLATQLLKDAGFDPPSKLGKRTQTCPKASFFPDACRLWSAQMERNLGLNIEVAVVDIATELEQLNSGNFDFAAWGITMKVPVLNDYFGQAYGPVDRNYTRWNDSTFQGLYDDQLASIDADLIHDNRVKMEKVLLGGADPYIEWFWNNWWFLARSYVRTAAGDFVPPSTLGILDKYEHIWLDKG